MTTTAKHLGTWISRPDLGVYVILAECKQLEKALAVKDCSLHAIVSIGGERTGLKPALNSVHVPLRDVALH